MEFQPGDRVFYSGYKDAYGVVLAPCDGEYVPIRFDERIGAHDCDGLCEDGHGWYASLALLQFISGEDNAKAINIDDIL